MDIRAADTRFVLDRLAALDAGRNRDAGRRSLPRGLRSALDLSRVGMFGHSMGGATAAVAMYRDRQIDAGIVQENHFGYGGSDGLAPAARAGLDRPLLLSSEDSYLREKINHLQDPSWIAFWKRTRGWKLDLSLRAATHSSYTDMQALLPQIAQAKIIKSSDPLRRHHQPGRCHSDPARLHHRLLLRPVPAQPPHPHP